jgi:signal transduction histidine kinase
VTELIDEIGPSAQERGVVLEVGGLCPTFVACSPGVLTSMVQNLVDNAVKFIAGSPLKRVRVEARCEGARTRVEVRDTGPGVARSMRVAIFDPYVRAPGSTAPGLGLGLATVRRLAEAHGGAIGVVENAPVGSVFWFELPNAVELGAAHARPSGLFAVEPRGDSHAHQSKESHG